MELNKAANRLFVLMAFFVGFYCKAVSAEVVYFDGFDGATVEPIAPWPVGGSPDPEANWITIYNNLAFRKTEVTTGGGSLVIRTEDSTGGVISPVSSDYDFFDRELTYTFEGVSIEALGKSRLSNQWVQFGLVAHSQNTFWSVHSTFIIAYNGTGGFQFNVQQPLNATEFDRAPRKEFKSRAFNFDISFLRKIELTLDSVNYRVSFVFENDLDTLTFGGPHNLDRDTWWSDSIDIGFAESRLVSAEKSVQKYQADLDAAQLAGDQAAINQAQSLLTEWQGRYDERLAIFNEKAAQVEALKGDVGLLISASSDAYSLVSVFGREAVVDSNGDVGARISVNSVKVETSSILEGL